MTYGINRLIKARKIIDPVQSIGDFSLQNDKIIQLSPPLNQKQTKYIFINLILHT